MSVYGELDPIVKQDTICLQRQERTYSQGQLA